MSEKYYVRFRGRVLGPFTQDKTVDMVRRGQITRVHELSPDGVSWRKADEFQELYPTRSKTRLVSDEQAVQKDLDRSESVSVSQPPVEHVKWYVHLNGSEVGPIDEPTMIQWAREGKVDARSMVWKQGMAEWQLAEVIQPHWFPTARKQLDSSGSTIQSGEVPTELVQAMTNRAPWVQFLAIFGIICMALGIVSSSISILMSLKVIPENRQLGMQQFLSSTMGLINCIALLWCMFLLQSYAYALTVLKTVPSMAKVIDASRRLSRFWFVFSLVALAWLILVLLLSALLFMGSLLM